MWREILRDKIFADWPLAKILGKNFAVRRSQSHPHTGCMLTTPTSYDKVGMASEFSFEAMVRGCHIYGMQPLVRSNHVKESPIL